MLAVATLLTVLDSIASGVRDLEVALGIVGTEAGSIGFAAASDRDLLATINDATVQRDLLPAFAGRADWLLASTFYPAMSGATIQRALDRHYGASVGGSGLNAFLTASDARVHPSLRKIGFLIDSINALAPEVDPAARYDGTGVGTGTFVAGSDVNTALYGEAPFEVVVEVIGGTNRTIRLTMKRFDGSAVLRDVLAVTGSPINTIVPVGAGADRFIGVTAIETIGGGGEASDRLRVRSTVERALP